MSTGGSVVTGGEVGSLRGELIIRRCETGGALEA